MSDDTNEKKAEDEGMTKLGVSCGGPEKKVPAGTKEASEACPECGDRHDVEEDTES